MGSSAPLIAAGIGAAVAVVALLLFDWLFAGRSRSRLRETVDAVPGASVVRFDRDLKLVEHAGAALPALAWTRRETRGSEISAVLGGVEGRTLSAHCRAALRGESRSIEHRPLDGQRTFWIRVLPLTKNGEPPRAGIIVALDLTDQERGRAGADEQQLEAPVVEMARSLARTQDPTIVRESICETARLVAGSQMAALLELSADGRGLVAKMTVGGDLGGMFIPLNQISGMGRAFKTKRPEFSADVRVTTELDRELGRRTRTRSIAWYPLFREGATVGVLTVGWAGMVPELSFARSRALGSLATEAEIAIGRSELLGQLEQLARTDELTGLPNRRAWDEELAKEVARAQRDDQPLCVAMLDLDRFKSYNDLRGHQAGDRLLREAAAIWRSTLRPYDTLARYGGEEFGVILPNCSVEEGMRLVERLRRSTPEGETVSAGIAEWDRGEGHEAMVGRADAALYAAKAQGRDRAVAASEGHPVGEGA